MVYLIFGPVPLSITYSLVLIQSKGAKIVATIIPATPPDIAFIHINFCILLLDKSSYFE